MAATSTAVARPPARSLLRRFGLAAALVGGALLWAYFFARNGDKTTAVLASTVRLSTPLLLGALCGLIGERSGVVNIGIEGQMLTGAFIGFLVASSTGSLLAGVAGAVVAGMVIGTFLAWCAVTLELDQIIAGTVVNILAVGFTTFLYRSGRTLPGGAFKPIRIPGLGSLPIVGKVVFQNPPITYAAVLLMVVLHVGLYRTRWGLRTRAVGEHPSAADTVGVDVGRLRYRNVTIAGGFAGLAGAFLSLESVGSFERSMTNGRGFVALAVMIFGRWTPLGAWAGALLFGLANAMQNQLQLDGTLHIPPQFIGMLPYVLTIVVLAGLAGRSRAPAAAGRPYRKE